MIEQKLLEIQATDYDMERNLDIFPKIKSTIQVKDKWWLEDVKKNGEKFLQVYASIESHLLFDL